MVSTVAGSGALVHADGVGYSAGFNSPYGLAQDSNGTLYTAEYGGQTIRKIGVPLIWIVISWLQFMIFFVFI